MLFCNKNPHQPFGLVGIFVFRRCYQLWAHCFGCEAVEERLCIKACSLGRSHQRIGRVVDHLNFALVEVSEINHSSKDTKAILDVDDVALCAIVGDGHSTRFNSINNTYAINVGREE